MPVTLESIRFNHDATFTTTGAFYIRRNETTPVIRPASDKDRCGGAKADCSPVAYSIDRLPKTITIKARFTAQDLPSDRIWIRGVGKVDDFLHPPRANFLGDTDAVEVAFVNGEANDVPFH